MPGPSLFLPIPDKEARSGHAQIFIFVGAQVAGALYRDSQRTKTALPQQHGERGNSDGREKSHYVEESELPEREEGRTTTRATSRGRKILSGECVSADAQPYFAEKAVTEGWK